MSRFRYGGYSASEIVPPGYQFDLSAGMALHFLDDPKSPRRVTSPRRGTGDDPARLSTAPPAWDPYAPQSS